MVCRDSKPTRVQTWWDSVDIERNIMESIVCFNSWLLFGNVIWAKRDGNNEYVPWSLFPFKWLCHRCHILLRWTIIFFKYSLVHPSLMVYPFLSLSLSLAVFFFRRRSYELKTQSDESSESLVFYTLAQFGPSLRGSVLYGGYSYPHFGSGRSHGIGDGFWLVTDIRI